MSDGERRRIKRGWMRLKVADLVQETHDTVTIVLVDADDGGRAFDYQAGQYLTFRFDALAAKPIVRSYTLSSSPCQKEAIAFTVKEVNDPFVSKFLCHDVKVGDVLRARGPIGKFCFIPGESKPNLAMIAAGSGVTPFISIIREFANCVGSLPCPTSLRLLVSYRRKCDVIFARQLSQWGQKANIDIRITLSREDPATGPYWHGRIDAAKLRDFVGNRSDKATTYMLCGPIPMMELASGALIAMGVDPEDIKSESFAS